MIAEAEFSPPSTIEFPFDQTKAQNLFRTDRTRIISFQQNSMSIPLRLLQCPRARSARTVRCFASSTIPPYGRTAPYRRIHTELQSLSLHISSSPKSPLDLLSLRPQSSQSSQFGLSFTSRPFSTLYTRFQEQQQREKPRDIPRQDPTTDQASEGYTAKSASRENSEGASEESKAKPEGSSGKSEGEGSENSSKEEQKKEEPPPPPPHGNKTPWQVFTETLKTEFQASKEWNESTKALASSAHQFTENESVKRARQAYSAASGTATSATASALKGTGKALGQGAAWTWDTPVVKGVRTGVSATASGIEKATRPVRETKVYKTAVGSVKDVVDDGSSSRYGGWVEKEERRKQRELRELNEGGANGRAGRQPEKIEEDPK